MSRAGRLNDRDEFPREFERLAASGTNANVVRELRDEDMRRALALDCRFGPSAQPRFRRTCPPLPPSWFDELRNAVVHNGKIASRADAIKFGDCVLQTIRKLLRYIQTHHNEAKILVKAQTMPKQLAANARRVFHGHGTILNSAMASQPTTPLEEELATLSALRPLSYVS